MGLIQLNNIYGKKERLKTLFLVAFMIFAVCVFAQSTVKSKKSISQIISLKKGSKPVVVVDGIIYKGELDNIDERDVQSIDVIKGKDAVNIYGGIAKEGAVLITTKQPAPNPNKKIEKITQLPSIIINGIVADSNTLKKIDPNDVAWITILKNERPNDHITPVHGRGVSIYTKEYVIKANTKKIINHSMAYEACIQKDPIAKIKYMLDGKEINIEDSQKLFELPDDAFKSVTLEVPKEKNPAIVKITTIPKL